MGMRIGQGQMGAFQPQGLSTAPGGNMLGQLLAFDQLFGGKNQEGIGNLQQQSGILQAGLDPFGASMFGELSDDPILIALDERIRNLE